RLESQLSTLPSRLASLALARLEGHLEHSVAQCVAIQALDGHQRLIVVGHCDEAKALALVRLQIANHLNRLDGAKGAKELPEQRLLSVRGKVVDEDAPTSAAIQRRIRRNQRIGENVTRQWRISIV